MQLLDSTLADTTPANDAATETPKAERQPIAILYIPHVKSTKAVKIFGATGRYSFVHSPLANNRPARVYYDAAEFQREEQDIRRNFLTNYAVCTLLGSPDLAVRAEQALQELIGARNCPAGRRKAALYTLLLSIVDALEAIEGRDPLADAYRIDAEQISHHLLEARKHVEAEPMDAELAKDPAPDGTPAALAETPAASAPSPASPAPASHEPAGEAPPKEWQPKESYTEKQLNEMPLDDLRALATHYQVSGTYRREIIRAWSRK